MKWKKIFICISIVLIIICVWYSVKNSKKGYVDKSKKELFIMSNPQMTEDDYWGEDMFPDIVIDKTGENISASIEKEEYSLSDKSINVLLESGKISTGFYFYGIPAIERLEGEQWVRLGYNQSDPSREQWCICAIEGAEDMNYSTRLSVDIDNISEEFREGSYRVAVFLSDRCVYVPFSVTGGSK